MISVELWTKPMLKTPRGRFKHTETITTLLRGTISTQGWVLWSAAVKIQVFLT